MQIDLFAQCQLKGVWEKAIKGRRKGCLARFFTALSFFLAILLFSALRSDLLQTKKLFEIDLCQFREETVEIDLLL